MHSSSLMSAAAAAVVSLAALPVQAETGDFDGDGRLSIADLLHLQTGLPPAPGSLAGFEAHPCFPRGWEDMGSPEFLPSILSGLTYLEVLRRAVPDPLPHWVPLWSESPPQGPPPLDPRVSVELVAAAVSRGGSDRVRLELRLDVLEPLKAFALILEGEGDVLRVAPLKETHSALDWLWLWAHAKRDVHSLGDLEVAVEHGPFLVTRGRCVVSYGLERTFGAPEPTIQPGSYAVAFEARLAKGTLAGAYGLRILGTSQCVLEDGSLVAPVIDGAGRVIAEDAVTQGWDEGVPPLRLDPAERRVLGSVELRVTEAAGRPGETVTVRVQLRTEVPLNQLFFSVKWPPGYLTRAQDPAALLAPIP